jgi:hypothetical protein
MMSVARGEYKSQPICRNARYGRSMQPKKDIRYAYLAFPTCNITQPSYTCFPIRQSPIQSRRWHLFIHPSMTLDIGSSRTCRSRPQSRWKPSLWDRREHAWQRATRKAPSDLPTPTKTCSPMNCCCVNCCCGLIHRHTMRRWRSEADPEGEPRVVADKRRRRWGRHAFCANMHICQWGG